MDSSIHNISLKSDIVSDKEIKVYSLKKGNIKLSKSNCKLKHILIILIILLISILISYIILFILSKNTKDKIKIRNIDATEIFK